MKNFWQQLPTPFTVLAPLDGVTDVVFRQMITGLGKPDVLFTEFTMVEGLLSRAGEKVAENFRFFPNEQPIVAQIWGTKPESFYKAAGMVKELGFAGIDINMGCPDRTVIKGGACSALIKNPGLAAEIIQATKEGVKDLPVSVKTRIGFETQKIEEWIGFLLQQDLAALSVHLRTVEELSKVPAHWEKMPEIMGLRHELAPQTRIIGNGDITTLTEMEEKYKQYGCEGFMVGRGIFANPWMLNPSVSMEDMTVEQRLDLYLEHIKLFEKAWGKARNFANLKKFCKTYISNFPDASNLREQLMLTKTLDGLVECINRYKRTITS
jgi:tRNA-dihydrouridine synthase